MTEDEQQGNAQEFQQHLQDFVLQGDSAPVIGETFQHIGRTYECVNVDWDRSADEIVAIYRNKDRPDEPFDPEKYARTVVEPFIVEDSSTVRIAEDNPYDSIPPDPKHAETPMSHHDHRRYAEELPMGHPDRPLPRPIKDYPQA